MNEFRDRMLGVKRQSESLLRAKGDRALSSRTAEDESFTELSIPREAARQANHRDNDRHRLDQEQLELSYAGRVQHVRLINLSGGGAMIEGADDLKLWDRVELRLGSHNSVEAAVRWVKGDRFGLEFAHETRIEASDDDLAQTLRSVIQRSFPDIVLAEEAEAVERDSAGSDADQSPEATAERDLKGREVRHPLIWSGHVHYNHESIPVRLRNISSGGALLECGGTLKVGAELLLDLDAAGAIFASVHWAHGDAVGLKFHAPYDLSRLAAARPEVAAARWVAPDYLRDDQNGNSPWASQWGRGDVAMLHRSLEKRRAARKF